MEREEEEEVGWFSVLKEEGSYGDQLLYLPPELFALWFLPEVGEEGSKMEGEEEEEEGKGYLLGLIEEGGLL